MAVRRSLPADKPDLVLSGVNSGQNAADDVTYSGTVAGRHRGHAARRPVDRAEPGLSARRRPRIPFETSETHGPDIIRRLIDFGFPEKVLYNVNFPNRAPDEIEGIMVARQGKLAHGLHIDERFDGRGNPISGSPTGDARTSRRAPTSCARDGASSVTPLRLDMTAYDLGDPLRHHFAGAAETGGR